jgi:hypothetical protein
MHMTNQKAKNPQQMILTVFLSMIKIIFKKIDVKKHYLQTENNGVGVNFN